MITRMMKLQFMIKHFSDNFQGVHCLSVHSEAISEVPCKSASARSKSKTFKNSPRKSVFQDF